MNRKRILRFNIVLGVHYIAKVSFTALITVYCIRNNHASVNFVAQTFLLLSCLW